MLKLSIFWFRRDLRLHDNAALHHALQSGHKVLPLFIFDDEILDKLPQTDARVSFIYETLRKIDEQLKARQSSLLVKKGNPLSVFKTLIAEYSVQSVYTNTDYEPYATERDRRVRDFLASKNILFHSFKDQVIFEKNEVLKNDGKPYTVYTPYKNKWLSCFKPEADAKSYNIDLGTLHRFSSTFPPLSFVGFGKSPVSVKPYKLSNMADYEHTRDFPAKEATTYLSPYLRFGLLSIREIVKKACQINNIFLSELIWREFFMQILYHFPQVVIHNFRRKYDKISWRNNPEEFEMWTKGKTGYRLVDAGMRELNATGYMHNRVRMVVAGFLCKHLLIDWRWGEAYFAEKLLDYELSSNNGNWQWAAGTGCDAAPYFRVFNPMTQAKKFDPDGEYISKWLPEIQMNKAIEPIVEHKMARERAIKTYKQALN